MNVQQLQKSKEILDFLEPYINGSHSLVGDTIVFTTESLINGNIIAVYNAMMGLALPVEIKSKRNELLIIITVK